MFIFNQSLLFSGTVGEILLAAAPAFLGVFFLATFAIGYFAGPLGWLKRFVMAIAGILLIHPNLPTDLVGVGIGAAIYLSQRMGKAARKEVA